jgi:hypothetical protein
LCRFSLLVVGIAVLASSATAYAGGSQAQLPVGGGKFQLSGSAQIITGGPGLSALSVDLTSNCGAPYSNTCYSLPTFSFSNLDFTPKGSLTVSGISTLSTNYNFGGADCGGGSPRIAIQGPSGTLTCGYFGFPPEFTSCYTGWLNSGNWANTSDTTVRWDNLCNGTAVNDWSGVLSTYGSQTVTAVDLIVDGGWFSSRGQDLLVTNFKVNNSQFPGVF